MFKTSKLMLQGNWSRHRRNLNDLFCTQISHFSDSCPAKCFNRNFFVNLPFWFLNINPREVFQLWNTHTSLQNSHMLAESPEKLSQPINLHIKNVERAWLWTLGCSSGWLPVLKQLKLSWNERRVRWVWMFCFKFSTFGKSRICCLL